MPPCTRHERAAPIAAPNVLDLRQHTDTLARAFDHVDPRPAELAEASPAYRQPTNWQDNPLDVGDLTTCRYSDEAFPQPADPVPQQIHIMPASERFCLQTLEALPYNQMCRRSGDKLLPICVTQVFLPAEGVLQS